jgi:hypothetical protein
VVQASQSDPSSEMAMAALALPIGLKVASAGPCEPLICQ